VKKNKQLTKKPLLLFFYLKAVFVAAIVVFIGVYHYLSLSAVSGSHSSVRAKSSTIASRQNKDLEKRDAIGYTPLMQAISDADIERIKQLIADGADVNAYTDDRHGLSVLELAVFNGNETGVAEIVDILLEAGADPSLPSKQYGDTPLHHLPSVTNYDDKLKVAMSLMKHNAPINAQNNAGDTPMHSIVQIPHLASSVFMIDNFGPMIDMGIWNPAKKSLEDNMHGGIKGSIGQTVWELALLNVVKDPLHEHLRKGRQRFGRNDSAKRDILGHTGLMLAVMRNDKVFAEDQITNQGAEVNAIADNKHGNRPLHFACMRSYNAVPFIELLIKHGADPSLTNALEEKPIDVINKRLSAEEAEEIRTILKSQNQ